jgi:hypothetical protein
MKKRCNLYKIELTAGRADWEDPLAFVVAAETPSHGRTLCFEHCLETLNMNPLDAFPWRSTQKTKTTRLGLANRTMKPQIILEDNKGA